jgi:ParB family chromosome partitioning protein
MEGNERRFMEIPLSLVFVSGNNPRKNFNNMDELVASVRTKGVLEPILVRPLCPEPTADVIEALGRYEIVAGERRFRAAKAVAISNGGLENYKIPAMVQEMSDDEAFDVRLIENLHREDLTELEEAQAFKMFLDRHAEEGAVAVQIAERDRLREACGYRWRKLLTETEPKEEEGK